jgi:hyperosmotically inducible periplasmic protein
MNVRRVCVVVVLTLLACAAAVAAQTDTAAQERAIQSLLVDKLGDDAAAIRVTLVKGKAILTGEVKQRQVQELCEEVAQFAKGVTKVDNQVTTGSAAKLGQGKIIEEAGDADLESSVNRALKAEIGKHTKTIEIEASGGWVSLRGTSPDAARKEITLATAAKVEGVKKVIDLLRVETK